MERLALGGIDRAARRRELLGVAFTFRIYHAVKVPWAAALRADGEAAGRGR